jgi:hypothetical protein
MSHTRPATTSSSNFQLIINNALKEYEKRTKNDLLAHPLAAQLQACDSPTRILAVLQQQVQEHNQSRTRHENLTAWLDPTVNVLYALSATLGEGVGLVCPSTLTLGSSLSCVYFSGIFSSEGDLCWCRHSARGPCLRQFLRACDSNALVF